LQHWHTIEGEDLMGGSIVLFMAGWVGLCVDSG